jgi:predicted RNase H-like HicB family nuclease
VVAKIPALQIADFGVDVPEALDRLQSMATFHLDCLIQEGKPVPTHAA